MRECECTHDHRHEWLEPLFSGSDFNEQWEELGKRIGKIYIPSQKYSPKNRWLEFVIVFE